MRAWMRFDGFMEDQRRLMIKGQQCQLPWCVNAGVKPFVAFELVKSGLMLAKQGNPAPPNDASAVTMRKKRPLRWP